VLGLGLGTLLGVVGDGAGDGRPPGTVALGVALGIERLELGEAVAQETVERGGPRVTRPIDGLVFVADAGHGNSPSPGELYIYTLLLRSITDGLSE
jgi:hypothetical protein